MTIFHFRFLFLKTAVILNNKIFYITTVSNQHMASQTFMITVLKGNNKSQHQSYVIIKNKLLKIFDFFNILSNQNKREKTT